jgi:hypothetical protein
VYAQIAYADCVLLNKQVAPAVDVCVSLTHSISCFVAAGSNPPSPSSSCGAEDHFHQPYSYCVPH